MKKKSISIQVDEDILKSIERKAREEKRSRSSMLQLIIESFFKPKKSNHE